MALDIEIPDPPDLSNRGVPREFEWQEETLGSEDFYREDVDVLVSGVIWGVWHWPVVAMGHNYGLDYPGAPWTGLLAMTWFTVVVGAFLAWVTVRAGSVWPAVVGHAVVNGVGGLGLVFVSGNPTPLLGPAAVGVVASLGWAVVAVAVLQKEPERR